MKNNCEIVKDLIPLYADEVCSESSRELVDEHIKECENCEKELENCKLNITVSVSTDEKKAVSDFGKKMKKNNLKKIVVSVVLCLSVILGSAYALLVPEFNVPYAEGLMTAKIPEDGGVDVWVNLDNYSTVDSYAKYNENNEIDIYLVVKQNFFTKLFKDSDPSDNFWRTNGFICASVHDGKIEYISSRCTIKNIYYVDMDLIEVSNLLAEDDENKDALVKEARVLLWSAK